MGGMGGTATLNLNTGNFSKIKTLLPDKCIIEKYHKKIEPIMQKILENEKQSQALAEIRDTLLPQLLNGQVRI